MPDHDPPPPAADSDLARVQQALRQGDAAGARAGLAHVLRTRQGDPRAWFLAGALAEREGRLEEAIAAFRRSLALAPGVAPTHDALGRLLLQTGDVGAARGALEAAIAVDSGHRPAWQNLLECMRREGREDEALRRLWQAASTAELLALHSETAFRWGRFDEAFDSAAAMVERGRVGAAEVQNLVVCALRSLRCARARAILSPHQRALSESGAASFALGRVLAALGELDEAERWQRHADRLDPARVDAVTAELSRLRFRFTDTVRFPYRTESDFIACCQARWLSGDWDSYERDYARIAALARRRVEAGELPGLWPNYAVFFSRQDPGLELAVNRVWGDFIDARVAPLRHRLGLRHAPRTGRIRVGLVSPDFRNNAVSHMLTGFMRHMDRRQFELVGFATQAPGDDHWGRLAGELLDELVDVSALDNAAVAARIHAGGIDVLCETYGYGPLQRPEIFALRPAPVQMLLTGFPGSIGAPWIDYIVATDRLIPDAHRDRYREKVVKVPVSRHVVEGFPVATRVPTRAELGLPEQAVVLACLHRASKIDPAVFRCWMEVMAGAPHTCLWLLRYSDEHATRLRARAAGYGVDPDRIVFCAYVPLSEHIARLRQADVYLDTFVFGGFNSSAMALYAGLPVVTLAGENLSTRMAADACLGCGVGETVASDAAGYQAVLRALIDDRGLRDALRGRLADPDALAFFSPAVTARHMGRALVGMVERYRAGRAPEDFRVAD